ncbi:MAG: nitrate reductase molybdenum cofactor assembly chaperone [Cellvibrionaceae bacterium]
MQILKIISLLMDYPTQDAKDNFGELVSLIWGSREISPEQREGLELLAKDIYERDLMDSQERYSELFDKGRALSLLLFEHVHGESRDRGQAMVDLMAQYEQAGFSINVRELPDYIPLYLEYLSTQPEDDARVGLADVSHILGLLSVRLQERDSPYSHLFTALLQICGANVNLKELREQVSSEKRDDTPEELDKVWEEEAITFGMGDTGGDAAACPSMTAGRPGKSKQPIAEAVHFVNGQAV